jgi:YD repeat-containing protein
LTLPNAVEQSYGYNSASEVTSIAYENTSGALGDLAYAYDEAGRVRRVTGSYARAELPAAVSSATYDDANRLTSWGSTTLDYDDAGNLVTEGLTTYDWDAGASSPRSPGRRGLPSPTTASADEPKSRAA